MMECVCVCDEKVTASWIGGDDDIFIYKYAQIALSLREAILQKIPEFYEIFHKRGGVGSTGFHISYSEIVNDPKSVGKSE